jgi:hypothetical protein
MMYRTPALVLILLSTSIYSYAALDSRGENNYDAYNQIKGYPKKEEKNPGYSSYDEIRGYGDKDEDEEEDKKETCDCSVGDNNITIEY